MNRELYIHTLSQFRDECERKHMDTETEAFNAAIQALSADGDCISRQAAIDTLEKVAELFPWRVPGKSDTYDSYNEAWNDAIGRAEMEIESLLSAQPEIIRCKDCENYQIDWKPHCEDRHYCAVMDSFMPDDGFCNYAERRNDG